MRVADYIAKFLVDQGVEDIFMLTGYGAMYLNDAIELAGIKYYAARNEAAVPMMAEAYARVKQSLAAVCVTAGPGSTNAVPGLAEAWVDSAPVLVLSGQVDKKYTTHAARTEGLRTFGVAEIDIIPVVKPLTKFAVMVEDPERIRYILEKAVYLATSGRPGPVWIDVPLDIQRAHIDPENLESFSPPKKIKELSANISSSVAETLELMKNANYPLIVCGHGVRQANAIYLFKNLIQRWKVPFIFSRLGQDIMPHSHPYCFGQAGTKGSRYCQRIMRRADVVLVLGCRLAIPFVGQNFEAFSPQVKIIMVDIDEAELKKPGVPISLPVHTDVREFINRLLTEHADIIQSIDNSWISYCRRLKDGYPIINLGLRRNPIDLYYFMHRLNYSSNSRHIMVTDAGSNYYIGGQVWTFEHGQREVCSGCNAAMGLSIPLAIGAAIASPSSQVLAVTGDGSLELNIQELKTIAHYNLNIKLFVINNGGYVSMRKWQDDYFEGRQIDTEENTGAGTLNLRNIAKAFDLDWVCIEKFEEIDNRLTEIMKEDGPLFVEVMTDNNQKIIEAFDPHLWEK